MERMGPLRDEVNRIRKKIKKRKKQMVVVSVLKMQDLLVIQWNDQIYER